MIFPKPLFLLTLVAALPRDMAAQRPPWLREPYVKAAVYGRIIDSASGRPIEGVRMRVDRLVGIFGSDKDGWYLLFGLPPGVRRVDFYCPSQRRLSWTKVATRLVEVSSSSDSLLNFQVRLSGCHEPPEHTWTAEFRGHYTSGFESSDFRSCAPIERLDGTAYAGQTQDIWVDEFAHDAFQGIRIKSPETLDRYYPRLYVRWRATITGPGSYGHMGVGMYQMRVERVLEARIPGEHDCN